MIVGRSLCQEAGTDQQPSCPQVAFWGHLWAVDFAWLSSFPSCPAQFFWSLGQLESASPVWLLGRDQNGAEPPGTSLQRPSRQRMQEVCRRRGPQGPRAAHGSGPFQMEEEEKGSSTWAACGPSTGASTDAAQATVLVLQGVGHLLSPRPPFFPAPRALFPWVLGGPCPGAKSPSLPDC